MSSAREIAEHFVRLSAFQHDRHRTIDEHNQESLARAYIAAEERIRALQECLREFTQAGVEYGAPRYLTIQIGREQMNAARTLLAAEKREDEGNG